MLFLISTLVFYRTRTQEGQLDILDNRMNFITWRTLIIISIVTPSFLSLPWLLKRKFNHTIVN